MQQLELRKTILRKTGTEVLTADTYDDGGFLLVRKHLETHFLVAIALEPEDLIRLYRHSMKNSEGFRKLESETP